MLRPALFGANKPAFFEDSFDRLFENAFKGFWNDNELGHFSGFSTDVIDLGDRYQLQAELPGFQKEDINVDLKNDILTISAVHNEETSSEDKKNYVRRERNYSSYSRSFRVDGLESSDIDASYNNGILEINFPKKDLSVKEEAKKIEVT